MKITLLISLAAGILAFGIKYWLGYKALLALQPGNGVSADVTSYPPNAAWITALPWALGVFVLVFVILYLLRK